MCSSLCLLESDHMLKYQYFYTSSFETKTPKCKITVTLKSKKTCKTKPQQLHRFCEVLFIFNYICPCVYFNP